MKIAVVVPGGLHPSGIDQVMPSWLALFARLAGSHEIHAFVLNHLPIEQTYVLLGFTVHDLGRPSAPLGLTRVVQERALRRALDLHGPFDLIHGFFADPAGQLAARAGKRLGIPSIVSCDSGEFVAIPEIDYGSQRTARGRRAVHEATSRATRVHVCTHFMSALAAQRGIKTDVIPLTSVTSREGSLTPHRSSPADQVFRLVQAASLSRVKNQRLLIDALRLVRQRVDASLDLVGEDTLGGECQRHAAAIGMERHVTFHGHLSHDRALDVIANADLYVQSSLHEAAGVSVLEAAAAGVPTVGTRAGYVADWSPLKAVAVGDATPESLAEAILSLHDDSDRRQSITAAARTFAITHDAAWSASQFDTLYGELKGSCGVST